MPVVYFDNNATTPLDRRVLEAMMPYLTERYANPNSIYSIAKVVRQGVEEARQKTASALGCDESEIIFTAGGSESNNTVIKGVWAQNKGKGHIITSSIEHPAVLEVCQWLEKQGASVTYLPVDEYGMVHPEELAKTLRDDTVLVSVMFANNESGTINPVEELSGMCREKGVPFHTDAVQAVGKLPINLEKTPMDFLSLSAHKLNGPKGVGALYVRKGQRFVPLIQGGHQERNRRAGTENTAGIIGLGEALRIAIEEQKQETAELTRLRDMLHDGVMESIKDVTLFGHPKKRLPGTCTLAFKYLEGESILLSLDMEEICASTGSACSSGSLEPSHVYLAMGYSHEEAQGAVRFSMGRFNTQKDVEYVLEKLPPIIKRLRELSPLTPKGYTS